MINETAGNPASLVPPDIAASDNPRQVDERQPVLQGRKFIVFVLGGSRYAVDSQHVSEVLRGISAVRIPNTPEWLVGIANLRSEIVTVVDLEKALGEEPAGGSEPPKHIVIREEAMDAYIAFRVEKLREIATIDASRVRQPVGNEKPFESGTFEHKGSSCTVLNVGKLVESLKLT